ncbi:glycosyltransferase [Pedobacter sp. N36a]|uniref:beta-1,6-N-acetylglucosaminyltransferase n=1 Tax=Pedobacter sp. N36a TaxID=2767996 RepID=UPI001656D722|nr:beta-1,6-N-acetylglucosaminyltransferase [Pedobacter sp. N36a]MBC8986438.1 glycosyltransferase [Pedobacter sp. N36a]
MRVANIIIAHKNPLQLERLIRKMQHENFDFYIHIDKKIEIESFLFLKEIKGVYFIRNRVVCNWGGHSTLKAMLNSLKETQANETSYGFYNLMSAQDYPIRKNQEFYDFLLVHQKNSFIFYESEESGWWKMAIQRYQHYHLTDFNFFGSYFLERMMNKVLPIRKFPMSLKLYGGRKASWWTLNYESASYLSNFFNQESKLDKFLKFCWGTDEFVIPTILLNSPFKEQMINDNLRYIDFPEGKANPRILEMEDLPLMKDSNMFFARKFDMPMSEEVLRRIDEQTE